MTAPRPGGSTPRGLRYPGNDITVDEIPDAIQDLAEDVDRALGTTAGITVVQKVAYVTLDGSTGRGNIVFDTLASVIGCVVTWGQDNFGPGIVIALMSGNTVGIQAPLTAGLEVRPPVGPPNTAGPPAGSPTSPQFVKGRSVNVAAIAWGPKK